MRKTLGLQFRGAPVELGDRILENFGKRLKEWMELREVGLVDIAQNLGISYSYAAFLGKVKPYGRLLSPENAVALAEFLKIDPDEVFSAMGQINPYLAEKVPIEVLEAELLELHKRLRERIEGAEQEQRERRRRR
ncbi:MAG: helix-turn-helix domain-containing protein [Armatimonadota bacterium]|jgi:transcriptional regulator with XRE-family HTH domain